MIPVQQFPIIKPEDTPFYFGMQSLVDAYSQHVANQQSKQQTKNLQEQLKMLQAQTQGQNITNQYLPQNLESQIAAQNALVNFRNMGGGRMGVGQQQLMALKNQVASENPDAEPEQIEALVNAYLNGDETLPDGSSVPAISAIVQSMVSQVEKRNSTTALQNMAAKMDTLSEELKAIPVDSIAAFAGPKGRARYYKENALMASGQKDKVSKEFRDYKAYIDAIQKYDMDAIRNDFSTSVVPAYVNQTIGATLDPADSLWNDEAQVREQVKKMQEWTDKVRDLYKQKSKFGANAPLTKKPLQEQLAGMDAPPAATPTPTPTPITAQPVDNSTGKTYQGSDGKMYTREQLLKIAAGGK